MTVKPTVIALRLALLVSCIFSSSLLAAEETNSKQKDNIKNKGTGSEPSKQVDDNSIVYVTGTRIPRKAADFLSGTPLLTIDRESIENSGVGSLAEIIIEEAPSVEEDSSNTNSQSSVHSTGLSTVQLRGLGVDRTLTLIDGRRVVPNSYSGNRVSLSTIPSGMVDRVEVITGGASAIYGSDAIAGVINIITQSQKEGFEFNARAGHTPEGGGEQFSLDLDYGSGFNGDRGYIYFSNSWDRDFGISHLDRQRAQLEAHYEYDDERFCNTMDTVDGDQCIRDISQSDWRDRSDGIAGGVFEEGRGGIGGYFFNQDGLQTDWNENRDGVYSDAWEALKIPNDSFASALKLDYKLNDDAVAFFQVHYSLNKSVNIKSPEDEAENSDVLYFDPTTGEPIEVRPGRLSIDNPFAPAEIANNAGSSISWDRRFFEVGNVITDNKRETIRSSIGFRGTLPESKWDWELGLSYGQFEQEQLRLNELNVVRLSQGLDAEYAEDGVTIQCADPQAREQGCVPVNIFGVGSISPEAADWIRANPTINTGTEQTNIAGSMTGELFTLGDRAVYGALGFEFRRDSLHLQTSEGHQNGGITFNIVPSFTGEIDVYEAFGELSAPLSDNFTLDASLRLADYSHENIDLTASYKLGFIWSPFENYSIRANYSRAQRAPNINELLSPPRGDFDSFDDICDEVTATSTDPGHDNCRLDPGIAATIAEDGEFDDRNNAYSPNAGNEQLQEETANTYTIGMVYTSPDIVGLNLALDYYDITIDDVISQYGNEDILNNCYNSSIRLGEDNFFCDEIRRDSDGQIVEILQRDYNLNQLRTRGYDLALTYDLESEVYGDFSFDLNWNHVIEHSETFQGIDGLETINSLGFLDEGIFEDRAYFKFKWKYNNFKLSWRTSYKSSTIDSEDRLDDYLELYNENQALFDSGEAEVPAYLFIPSYISHNLTLSYNLDLSDSRLKLYVGAKNIFDNKGPFIPNSGDNDASARGNSSSLLGAGVGRYVFLGFKYQFK